MVDQSTKHRHLGPWLICANLFRVFTIILVLKWFLGMSISVLMLLNVLLKSNLDYSFEYINEFCLYKNLQFLKCGFLLYHLDESHHKYIANTDGSRLSACVCLQQLLQHTANSEYEIHTVMWHSWWHPPFIMIGLDRSPNFRREYESWKYSFLLSDTSF